MVIFPYFPSFFLCLPGRVYPPNGAIPAVPQHFAIPHAERRIAQPAILLEGAYWAPGGRVEDARGAVAQHGPGSDPRDWVLWLVNQSPNGAFFLGFMMVWVKKIMNFFMDYWFTLWWTNSLL